MRYITEQDLGADSAIRFVTESSGDGGNAPGEPSPLDSNEGRAIDIVKSYIADRYDVGAIFGVLISEEGEEEEYTPPIRSELLVDIICKITLYKLFRRNAARKVPVDTTEDYKWALGQLERISAGRVPLKLPPAIEENGQPISTSIWGNNTNRNFYI